jgi:hypothetical protein
MGWNPWNAFHTEITEEKILAVANKLKQSGLVNAGYRYVNVDDGWWLKRRADGRIEARTSMFPSAAVGEGKTTLRPFVDRLHAMGLKAGIYTDIGRNACSQSWDPKSPNLPVGSLSEREVGTHGFHTEDMRLLFGEWGFDYVKVDACGLADYAPDKRYVRDGSYRAFEPYIVRSRPDLSDGTKVEALYADLKNAIDAVRPHGDYVLSICTWGEAYVADWGHRYGNLWRTSPDIRSNWSSMLRNFDSAASRPLYAGPGHWNDPDMLEVGQGDFDAAHPVEARAHMSMWAIINAPLILGADLTQVPQSAIDIMGNQEVIAVNQDPAGNQGVTIERTGDTQVIVKTLARPGHKAVALINRGRTPRILTVQLARLNLDPGAKATVRDLWTKQERGAGQGEITVELAPHETAMLLVRGRPQRENSVYLSDMPARLSVLEDGSETLPNELRAKWVPAQANAAPSGQPLALYGRQFDNGLGVLANSRLEVRLDQEFRRFRATVGVMHIPSLGGAQGEITYRVYGDGKLLLERKTANTAAIEVPLQGKQKLQLVALASPGVRAVIVWAEAELARD